MSFDRTLFDLPPLGFVSGGGNNALHSALLCLYFAHESVAALENVPLISMSAISTASRPQTGSIILVLQACKRSRALKVKKCVFWQSSKRTGDCVSRA
jgi:hypothetical protein